MSEFERMEIIKHCKWVDEVICPCPWLITDEFMKEHRIDYVAHDAEPYKSGDSDDIYAGVKRQGKFIETQRAGGVSTSDIVARILKNRDDFKERNLKKGYTRD